MVTTTYEYRVRPVVRYVLTEYKKETDEGGNVISSGCRTLAELDNESNADRLTIAMCEQNSRR